jgi:hypothetical protein
MPFFTNVDTQPCNQNELSSPLGVWFYSNRATRTCNLVSLNYLIKFIVRSLLGVMASVIVQNE